MNDADDDRRTARRALIVIGLLLATVLALGLVYATRRVLIWGLVAAFFAVALKPWSTGCNGGWSTGAPWPRCWSSWSPSSCSPRSPR